MSNDERFASLSYLSARGRAAIVAKIDAKELEA
jgi:hypothetical protein